MTEEREHLFEHLLKALNNEDQQMNWVAERDRRTVQAKLNQQQIEAGSNQ